MTEARDLARLHPSAISAIEQGTFPRPARQRRSGERSSRVTTRKLADDRLLQLAKTLADGDASRLQFNADGSITVRNR